MMHINKYVMKKNYSCNRGGPADTSHFSTDSFAARRAPFGGKTLP